MASSYIAITEGNGGKKVASESFVDPVDGLTKQLQKLILSDPSGNNSGVIGNPFWVTLANAIKGENGTLLRMMTGSFGKKARITGNSQIKPSMGFLHGFSIQKPVGAGTLTIYDSPTPTGDILWQDDIALTDGKTFITIDQICENGIYFSFGSGLAVGLGVSWI